MDKKYYYIKLPYIGGDYSKNDYALNLWDVDLLKIKAKQEGRSLSKYIAYHLKKIANNK